MEDSIQYINDMITESHINASANNLNKISNSNVKDIAFVCQHWKQHCDLLHQLFHPMYVQLVIKHEELSSTEKLTILFKDKARAHEKSLWTLNLADDAAWIKKLQMTNERIDRLKTALFDWEFIKNQSTEMADDIILIMFLHSGYREAMELENEIEYLKDLQDKNAKDCAEPSKILKNDTSKGNERLGTQTNEAQEKEAKLVYETKLKEINDFLHNMYNSYSGQYGKLLIMMQHEKIKKLSAVKETLVRINDTNVEELMMELLEVLSNNVYDYIITVRHQLLVAYNNYNEKASEQHLSCLHEQIAMFKEIFIELCTTSPDAKKLSEKKCRVAELEQQYAQLTEKPEERYTEDIIMSLRESMRKCNEKISAVSNLAQDITIENTYNVRFLLSEKDTNTLSTDSIEKYIEGYTLSNVILVNDEKESNTKQSGDGNELNDKKEVQHSKNDETHKERIETKKGERRKAEIYEGAKGTNEFKERKLQDKKNEMQNLRSENFKLENENKNLEMECKVYEEILKKLKLSDNIHKVLWDQIKINKDIMLKRQSSLNKDEWLSKQQRFHAYLKKIHRVQREIIEKNESCNLHKENLSSTKFSNIPSNEKRSCLVCSASNETLLHATSAISIISKRIVLVSAMYHVVPFKKLFETILNYITIERNVELTRRRKLHVEWKRRQGRRAKRVRRTKRTRQRKSPGINMELMEHRKLLNHKYVDSLAKEINIMAPLTKNRNDISSGYVNTIKESPDDEEVCSKTMSYIIDAINSCTIKNEDDTDMCKNIEDFFRAE
ncbi:uncharacterized protein LOC105181999 [Harpegnathos saltator]|uniref:uncharacterized protein LOC105181999 n=1 Tax=Harpegnathos saltator TaxID=610380 RepID=UPI00058D9A70|nr:uncharacterized protein LOC105181999 [Harpegnathos saltator]